MAERERRKSTSENLLLSKLRTAKTACEEVEALITIHATSRAVHYSPYTTKDADIAYPISIMDSATKATCPVCAGEQLNCQLCTDYQFYRDIAVLRCGQNIPDNLLLFIANITYNQWKRARGVVGANKNNDKIRELQSQLPFPLEHKIPSYHIQRATDTAVIQAKKVVEDHKKTVDSSAVHEEIKQVISSIAPLKPGQKRKPKRKLEVAMDGDSDDAGWETSQSKKSKTQKKAMDVSICYVDVLKLIPKTVTFETHPQYTQEQLLERLHSAMDSIKKSSKASDYATAARYAHLHFTSSGLLVPEWAKLVNDPALAKSLLIFGELLDMEPRLMMVNMTWDFFITHGQNLKRVLKQSCDKT